MRTTANALLALLITLFAIPAEADSDALEARLSDTIEALATPGGETIRIIEDDSNSLERVMRALEELGRGRAGRLKVRAAVYGDSNHINDHFAGALRARLGEVFGHGGHGFVAGARPWLWYQHTEINVKQGPRWEPYAATTPQAAQPIYGHVGIVGSGRAGGWIEYRSADNGPKDNRVFSTAEIFYLCRPGKGSFEVVLDDKVVRTVEAGCQKTALRREKITTKQGPHTLRLRAIRPKVTVLGVAFENDAPGVVVDGFGVGALSLLFMASMDKRLFIESMRARDYDLVVLHTGSNMWAPILHPIYMEEVLGRIRDALGPDVSILILSPPDFTRVRRGPKVGHKRMAQCRDEKRALSKKHQTAFWDFYAEMGGKGSVMDWYRKDMVKRDLVHFLPPFHNIMMDRLARAFFRHMLTDLEGPEAGSSAPTPRPPPDPAAPASPPPAPNR